MNKSSSLFLGLVLGASLMYFGLKYAVVRANNGFHFVPKSTATLGTAYIDIRAYTAAEWKNHIDLATDIARSDNLKLQEEVTQSAMNNSIDSMWQDWQNASP